MNRAVIAALLSLAVSCGGSEPATSTTAPPAAAAPKKAVPPTADETRALLADSAEFSEYQFTNAAYSLPMSRLGMNDPALAAAKDLARAKWIGFDGDGNVVLSPKATADRRWLVRQNGFVDIVPLAKKEFGTLEAVRTNSDGTAAADFTWNWVPNEIGSAFTSGPVRERYDGTQRATAMLLHDGTSWSVLRIEPR